MVLGRPSQISAYMEFGQSFDSDKNCLFCLNVSYYGDFLKKKSYGTWTSITNQSITHAFDIISTFNSIYAYQKVHSTTSLSWFPRTEKAMYIAYRQMQINECKVIAHQLPSMRCDYVSSRQSMRVFHSETESFELP